MTETDRKMVVGAGRPGSALAGHLVRRRRRSGCAWLGWLALNPCRDRAVAAACG